MTSLRGYAECHGYYTSYEYCISGNSWCLIIFGNIHPLNALVLSTVYSRYIAVVGVQAMIPQYKWERDIHDDVIKWKHFPCYWPFVRGIHRSPVNSPHKGQWRGALMFTFICAWINGWVNNREADHLRPYRTHYDVIVMLVGRLSWSKIRLHFPACCEWYWGFWVVGGKFST